MGSLTDRGWDASASNNNQIYFIELILLLVGIYRGESQKLQIENLDLLRSSDCQLLRNGSTPGISEGDKCHKSILMVCRLS